MNYGYYNFQEKINTNQPSLRLFIPNFVKVRNKCIVFACSGPLTLVAILTSSIDNISSLRPSSFVESLHPHCQSHKVYYIIS